MIYSVIGTGGIGGYYGGRLAQAGHDVHFLLHSDYEHVKEHGLQVDSVNGSFHRPLEIARAAGMPMPKLEMLEAELCFLQQK